MKTIQQRQKHQLQILCPEEANHILHTVGIQYRMIVPGGFIPGHLQLIYAYLLSKKISKVSIYRHRRCQYSVVRRLASLTVWLFRALPKLAVEVMCCDIQPHGADTIDRIEVVVIQCVDYRYRDLGCLSPSLLDRFEQGRALLIRVPGARAPRTLLTTLRRVAPAPRQVIVLAHPDCAYEKYFCQPWWLKWWWRGQRPAQWTWLVARQVWSGSEVILREDEWPVDVAN